MPNYGVGIKTQDKMKEHYVANHGISETSPALLDYVDKLLKENETNITDVKMPDIREVDVREVDVENVSNVEVQLNDTMHENTRIFFQNI